MLLASPVGAQECVDINSAYKLFEKCGSRSLKHLSTILQDPTEKLDVKADAVFALGQIGSGSKEAVNALIAFLQDPNPKISSIDRDTILKALGQIGSESEEAGNAVVAFLQKPEASFENCINAFSVLSQIGVGSKEAVSTLITFLNQDYESNIGTCKDHEKVVSALGDIGSESEDAINVLIAVLQKQDYSSSSNVRQSAAGALGQISFKLEKNKSKLSSEKLSKFISDLERALNILEPNKEKVFSDSGFQLDRTFATALTQA